MVRRILTVALWMIAAHCVAAEKPRLIVLTDVSNEPDDEESLVRLLVYSNEYDLEGMIATTSTWLRTNPRPDLIRRDIKAYGQVRDNLLKHAAGFPSPEQLLASTKTGQQGYGMVVVGEGRSTEGSRHIIDIVDRADSRPVWVAVWGGSNTLAQALWDVKSARSADETERFVSKLRIYAIADQDDSGRWLRETFPGLFYIVSPSTQNEKEYYRGTWNGISGDRRYGTGPMHAFALVDNPWLEQNVIRNHGPLGALYPRLAYIMEGDTPSFLGLIGNGLGWAVSPAYGGWGGRYALYRAHGETRPIWTNNEDSRDTVVIEGAGTFTSEQATIWRWREHFQHDFAARMDWCIAETYGKANHNPVAVLNGDGSKDVLEIPAKPGATVTLSCAGSKDPDGNNLERTWFVYPEAGSYRGAVLLSSQSGETTSLVAPPVGKPETIHVILQLRDDGVPALYSYRRAVVKIGV
jgi:Cellulose-binding Sde182, nucleoside hydrolase-like domain/Cellulose-binding protein Sde0182, C-terminal domain